MRGEGGIYAKSDIHAFIAVQNGSQNLDILHLLVIYS